MPYSIKIADTQQHVDWMNAEIEDVFAPDGDLCTVPMYFAGPEGGRGMDYLPELGQLLEIGYQDDRHYVLDLDENGRVRTDPRGNEIRNPVIVFRGVIVDLSMTYAPGGSLVRLEAQDMTYRLDSKMVAGVFTDPTVEAMVQSLVERHGPYNADGVLSITTNFDPPGAGGTGTSILPKVFQWKRFSEAMQEICEERRYVWWLDFDGVLHCIPNWSPRNLAPIPHVRPLDDIRIGAFKYDVSIQNLKNAIYIKEFFFESPNRYEEPVPQTESGFGGENIGGKTDPVIRTNYERADIRDFEVYVHEPDDAEFVRYPVVHDPGTGNEYSPGIVYADERLNFRIIRASASGREFPPGTTARWSYKALLRQSIAEVTTDEESIQAFADRETGTAAGNGEYQFVIAFGSIEFVGESPIETLHSYVETYLSQYAWPVLTGSFEIYYSYDEGQTADDDGFGWRAGQRFSLFAEEIGVYDHRQAYLHPDEPKVAVNVLVDSVRTTLINPTTIKYRVHFTSKFTTIL